MSTPFQNRLVGTIIVAAVAIIVLPDLLDGNKKTFQDEFEQIPPPPQVEFVKATKNFPHDKIVEVPEETLSDELALDVELSNEDKHKISQAKAEEESAIWTPRQIPLHLCAQNRQLLRNTIIKEKLKDFKLLQILLRLAGSCGLKVWGSSSFPRLLGFVPGS